MAYDHPSPPERLSSRLTPYLRTVAPLLSGVGLGAVLVALSVDPSVPTPVRYIATPVAIVAGVFLFKWLGSLRDVWLDGDDILVDMGGRRVRVSLREVTDIRQSRLQKTKTITLRLTRNTPLGETVRFVPHMAMVPGFLDHPVARELRQRRERVLTGGDMDSLSGTTPSK